MNTDIHSDISVYRGPRWPKQSPRTGQWSADPHQVPCPLSARCPLS